MLRSFFITAALLVFLTSVVVVAGIQGQTTGSVSGRVLDADTHKPLPGVRVGSPETGYAVTDAEGRYTVSGVAPGRVKLSVRVDQIVYSDPKIVAVVAGRITSGVDFRTRLHADITGHIRDEDGNAISGVQVVAIRSEYSASGELRYELGSGGAGSGATGVTDAEGKYNIIVMAGRQYRLFAYKVRRYEQPISDAPADAASRLPSYAPVYYPNAKTLLTASPIVLESQERRNVDLRLSRASSYCLSATVHAGVNPDTMNFQLYEEERFELQGIPFPSVMPGVTGVSGVDGKIRICNLTPGRYRLSVYRHEQSGRPGPSLVYFNAVPVEITDRDVTGIRVNTYPRITVPGNVEWDSKPLNTPDVKFTFRLQPTPATNSQLLQVPQQFSFDTTSVIEAVVDISGLGAPYYVKDVLYSGASILRKSFVPTVDGMLRIIVGSDAGTVIAHVTEKDGQPAAFSHVILMPAEVQTVGELAATLNEGLTDQNGSYTSTSLAPGRYYVFATDAPLTMSLSGLNNPANNRVVRTPETLEMLMRARGKGQFITVGSNGRVEVSLVPIAVN